MDYSVGTVCGVQCRGTVYRYSVGGTVLGIQCVGYSVGGTVLGVQCWGYSVGTV